jgi:uncharacterized protein YfaS (alpha-2-macroglobulin family)
MEILREYSDTDGNALPNVTMGQEILVHLIFRGLDGRNTGNVALVDLLPGGFELVVPAQPPQNNYASASPDESAGERKGRRYERSSYNTWQCQFCVGGVHNTLQYADSREDRVVFYAGTTTEVQEIVYRIKATNVGKFTTPPAYGEAMYDRTVVARSIAGSLEVIRP